jgi:hypothetical protein
MGIRLDPTDFTSPNPLASPLTILFSRHTKRRQFIAGRGGAGRWWRTRGSRTECSGLSAYAVDTRADPGNPRQ